MAVSTPASVSKDFNHLAMELEVTALCGCINERSSHDSLALTDCVRSSYTLKVVTGHRRMSSIKEGKRTLSYRFPLTGLLCKCAWVEHHILRCVSPPRHIEVS